MRYSKTYLFKDGKHAAKFINRLKIDDIYSWPEMDRIRITCDEYNKLRFDNLAKEFNANEGSDWKDGF